MYNICKHRRSWIFPCLCGTRTKRCAVGRETLLLALTEKLNKKGYFSPLCKQLAASHACTINGHLIGNNHFYLSKFKIGSCPWNKQLLVEPSGNVECGCLRMWLIVSACTRWPVHGHLVGRLLAHSCTSSPAEIHQHRPRIDCLLPAGASGARINLCVVYRH